MGDLTKRQGKNISAMKNEHFLCLFAMTGRGLLCIDPHVPYDQHSPYENEATIGAAVLAMLNKSSILSTAELNSLIKSGANEERKRGWVEELSRQFSYRDKNKIYEKIMRVSIKELDGSITFRPTRHVGLDKWRMKPASEYIVISSESSNKEIGKALSEAFERCTNEV